MAILYKTKKEAQQAILSGAQQVGELVCTTMGPKGHNVMLDRTWSDPVIVHDGVSVAKEIELPDQFENMGAKTIIEAASKTNDRAGDGTTTATLLAWKLIEKGFRMLEEGANPMILKEGMNMATHMVVEKLKSTSRPVTEKEIPHVATISAASEEIGKIIAEAIKKVGHDGGVTVDEGMGMETTIEYKEGMMFDKGYGSVSFANKKGLTAEIENPKILFTDMIISSPQDLGEFLDKHLTDEKRNIVIIADSFEGMTLPLLVNNHEKGVIQAIAIPAPSFGIKRVWMLEDMAILTGGAFISRQSGRTLASILPQELGRAERVWCDADNTKIIGGVGSKTAISERIASIREQIKKEESEFEKKQLRDRIARLTGGMAIIKVGAATEKELHDRKERINDAVEATKSAIAEGIVAGGGIALMQCKEAIQQLMEKEKDPDKQAGIKLVLSVLEEPFRKILENAGETPEIILNWIDHNKEIYKDEDIGYDVVLKQYANMFEMGVIDPLRVTREALLNATSVASMALTNGAMISSEKKELPTPTPPMI